MASQQKIRQPTEAVPPQNGEIEQTTNYIAARDGVQCHEPNVSLILIRIISSTAEAHVI